MLKSLKLFILILGVFFMIGGGNLLLAQLEKSTDPVEQRIREQQERIDRKGLHWTAGRSWTSELFK